ncbi:MAG TPA: hypothetical protein VK148_30790 [Xanthobacteraceae bacterium]|jgi:hypothetical protein|nr:hypothetical protein [Xanthobacteraceae bacterium]
MSASSAKWLIIVLAFLLFATSIMAQKVRPECVKMRDQVGCTCALENGGVIVQQTNGRNGWASKTTDKRHVNEAFVQCMLRQGRR